MKTITWAGKNGNIFELRADCTIEMEMQNINLDGHIIETDEEPEIDANLELVVDGKIVDTCWNINFWKIIDFEDGLKKIWGLKIVITAEQAELVEKFLNEVIEDGKSEEVKNFENKKTAEKKTEEIRKAQEIIAKAENQKEIMTNAEYRIWAKEYNDLHNEGGEGFVPEFITKEQYEEAKKIVENI